ncbi:MAG: ribose-5-phosphate isomerase RpiA [Chromatiales bacterium]|jgi:ribose 5-phosphate isomerase A
MDQNEKKRLAATAAIDHVEEGMLIGVGTGSTVNFFIDALGAMKRSIRGAVSSSEASTSRLAGLGIEVVELNEAGTLDIYVDGADEADPNLHLIKGGGGALTREKIVAAASQKFVCIIDDSKLVDVLGQFPLPVEVIPMARSYVGRQLVAAGGQPELRTGFVTDNGNQIIDVHNLRLSDAAAMETRLNQIAGVVSVGIFAQRPADLLLIGADNGVRSMGPTST